jgi:hypothetical protein
LGCRDGDPKCDLDAACDGTCTIYVHARLLPKPGPDGALCYIAARLFSRTHDARWHPFYPPVFVSTGSAFRKNFRSSSVSVRCRAARTSCLPPPDPTGHVTITGAVGADYVTQARTIVDEDQSYFHVQLSGDGAAMIIDVPAVLQEGTYRSDQMTVDVSAPNAYFTSPAGKLVGALTISAVEPSGTRFRTVHGHFEAVLRQWVGGFTGGWQAIEIRADF